METGQLILAPALAAFLEGSGGSASEFSYSPELKMPL